MAEDMVFCIYLMFTLAELLRCSHIPVHHSHCSSVLAHSAWARDHFLLRAWRGWVQSGKAVMWKRGPAEIFAERWSETLCSGHPAFHECVMLFCPRWQELQVFNSGSFRKALVFDKNMLPAHMQSTCLKKNGEGVMNKLWRQVFSDFLQLPTDSLSLAEIFSRTWCTSMFLIQRADGGFIVERPFQSPPRETFLAYKAVLLHDVCDIPLPLLEEAA